MLLEFTFAVLPFFGKETSALVRGSSISNPCESTEIHKYAGTSAGKSLTETAMTQLLKGLCYKDEHTYHVSHVVLGNDVKSWEELAAYVTWFPHLGLYFLAKVQPLALCMSQVSSPRAYSMLLSNDLPYF